jgi:two-component SAPR family response regulator
MGHEGVIVDSFDQTPIDNADMLLVEPGDRGSYAFGQRARSERPEIAIVCISIYPPSTESRLLRPVAHLVKPFTLAELNTAVESGLGPAGPEHSTSTEGDIG